MVSEHLEYLEKRRDQIRYAEFIAAGLPIGSGIVESANKLVVEARLKGAGMHWERGMNPMVALRNVVCSDRWDEAWALIAERLRLGPRERAQARRERRQSEGAEPAQAAAVPEAAGIESKEEPIPVLITAEREPVPVPAEEKPTASDRPRPGASSSGPRRPAPEHPWRRMAIGKAQRAA